MARYLKKTYRNSPSYFTRKYASKLCELLDVENLGRVPSEKWHALTAKVGNPKAFTGNVQLYTKVLWEVFQEVPQDQRDWSRYFGLVWNLPEARKFLELYLETLKTEFPNNTNGTFTYQNAQREYCVVSISAFEQECGEAPPAYDTSDDATESQISETTGERGIPILDNILTNVFRVYMLDTEKEKSDNNPTSNNAGTTGANPMNTSKISTAVTATIDTNKQAMSMAAKLVLGKTINDVIIDKAIGQLPWYTKIFRSKESLKTNPFVKFGVANATNFLVQQFGADSPKLVYAAESMVQYAMVDMTTNSELLKGFVGEIEKLVTLPSFAAKDVE